MKRANNWFPWALGYLNQNNLTDLLISGSNTDTINILESDDYNSYPKNLIASFKTNMYPGSIAYYYMTDLDQDELKEITCYSQTNDTLSIYENTAGNDFALVYQCLVLPYTSACRFAFGDADKDGATEFITGGSSGRILVFKCVGDNDYQVVWMDTTRFSRAAYDPLFVQDMDGDSLPEFVMGCCHNPGNGTWTAVWKFYQADTTVADSFRAVYTDSLTGISTWPNYGASSSCGDIDGDGRPEAALAVSNNWLVYKGLGPGQFQRTYKAYTTGNGRAQTAVLAADMNMNGYAEVIESGAINSTTSITRIWEIMGEITWAGLDVSPLDSCLRVEWSTSRQFANYGFSVWRATDGGGPYAAVHETNDTIKLDTTLLNYTFNDSDVTTGLTYFYKVQAKLLNDSTQYIGPDSAMGVAGPSTPPGNRFYRFALHPCRPNPFSRTTTICYQIKDSGPVSLCIYNAAGQSVKKLVNKAQATGAYKVEWNGRDESGKRTSNGIYFCRLKSGGHEATRRMLIVR